MIRFLIRVEFVSAFRQGSNSDQFIVKSRILICFSSRVDFDPFFVRQRSDLDPFFDKGRIRIRFSSRVGSGSVHRHRSDLNLFFV